MYVQASFAVAQTTVSPKVVPLTVNFLGSDQITEIVSALTLCHGIFINGAANRMVQILSAVPRSTVQQAITGVNGLFLDTLDDVYIGARS